MDKDHECVCNMIPEVLAFIEDFGLDETIFGYRAIDDWRVVDRLRKDGVTIRVAKKIKRFMQEARENPESQRPARKKPARLRARAPAP